MVALAEVNPEEGERVAGGGRRGEPAADGGLEDGEGEGEVRRREVRVRERKEEGEEGGERRVGEGARAAGDE